MFVETMLQFDMFDDEGKSIIRDEIGLWKFLIRRVVMNQLQDKYARYRRHFYDGNTRWIWLKI